MLYSIQFYFFILNFTKYIKLLFNISKPTRKLSINFKIAIKAVRIYWTIFKNILIFQFIFIFLYIITKN